MVITEDLYVYLNYSGGKIFLEIKLRVIFKQEKYRRRNQKLEPNKLPFLDKIWTIFSKKALAFGLLVLYYITWMLALNSNEC
ncbi:hypothetical protein [Desulfotruncus arcticus]|uniref:hypothetical protein n=1 Tax=Desulfotruncus arcticus TaxID=341036 RepID=UPI0013F4DD95|nr:hypothetical protein [Desulfotruncus arcticus]